MGGVDTVLSVDAVAREAARIAAEAPKPETLRALAGGEPFLEISDLRAGYGKMEILHDFSLSVGRGQSLCLIGPNGAGKSTVLHSIFGFTNIFGGRIVAGGTDVTRLRPNDKLRRAGIAYILQDNSVFPDMTVEENLWMGGYLKESPDQAKEAAERVFERYDRLRARRVRAAVDAPAIESAAADARPGADIQTPESAVLDDERRRTLTGALAGLPPEQRQLIEAAFFEGYTHTELAQRFGLPLGTVKTRIRAAMIAMRKRLEHAV